MIKVAIDMLSPWHSIVRS